MGALFGIVIVGVLIWSVYVRRFRVLASKRYATHQYEAPDLNRFAEGSTRPDPRTEGQGGQRT
jgi:hypothetical protein